MQKIFLRGTLACLFMITSIFSREVHSQEARYDEDQAAFELRQLCGQRVITSWVDPDGLTFPERESLYGFTVAPELLVDDFVMHSPTAVGYATNGWSWPLDEQEKNLLLHRLDERCRWAAAGAWLSRDEFHRVLASHARVLEEEFGYALHVGPEVFFDSEDPEHTTPLHGLAFILTPIE